MFASRMLNEDFAEKTFQNAAVRTQCERIDQLLPAFVAHQRRLDIRDLPGTVTLDENYDYKKLRGSSYLYWVNTSP